MTKAEEIMCEVEKELVREKAVVDAIDAFAIWLRARLPYGAELVYKDGVIEFHKIEEIVAEMRKDFGLCK